MKRSTLEAIVTPNSRLYRRRKLVNNFKKDSPQAKEDGGPKSMSGLFTNICNDTFSLYTLLLVRLVAYFFFAIKLPFGATLGFFRTLATSLGLLAPAEVEIPELSPPKLKTKFK